MRGCATRLSHNPSLELVFGEVSVMSAMGTVLKEIPEMGVLVQREMEFPIASASELK
jgi:hypothetical protein